MQSAAEIIFEKQGSALIATLNRPRQLNALTREMCVAITDQLRNVDPAETTAIVLTSAGEKGFCGGGDIKQMVANLQAATAFLDAEYTADLTVASAPVPVVSLMHGITMGGGIGLAGHAAIRVVAENARLAMPETRIGIIPDVGINRLLAATPACFGELIAATSASFNAAEALATGFADAHVPHTEFAALVESLAAGSDPQTAVQRATQELTQPTPLLDFAHAISAQYDATVRPAADPIAALHALRDLLQAQSDPIAAQLAASLDEVSPLTAAAAHWRVLKTRTHAHSPRQALAADLIVLERLVARDDFAEGVRARLIDKDNAPQWRPRELALGDAELAAQIASLVDPHPCTPREEQSLRRWETANPVT